MDLVQLVAPTTPDDRMRQIASSSSGYLYLVSRLGITGTGTGSDGDLAELVRRTKACAGKMPVAAGFGISTPKQMEQLRIHGADGAIVGSAILKSIMEGEGPRKVSAFVRSLKDECH